jgi:excinuclease UvrABC ATPase subunit
VAQGTPEQVAAEPTSHTGRYLARLLSARPSRTGAQAGQ